MERPKQSKHSVSADGSWLGVRKNVQSSAARTEAEPGQLKHVPTGPGPWPDIIQKCRVLQRTVLTGIPFLRIKAQNDSMAQEKRNPHHNVPDWPFPTVVDNEVKSHSKEHEEHKEHRVEVAQADGKSVFVHNSRQSEDTQHGSRFEPLGEKPEEVLVSIVVEPVMDHHIPGPVVVGV